MNTEMTKTEQENAPLKVAGWLSWLAKAPSIIGAFFRAITSLKAKDYMTTASAVVSLVVVVASLVGFDISPEVQAHILALATAIIGFYTGKRTA